MSEERRKKERTVTEGETESNRSLWIRYRSIWDDNTDSVYDRSGVSRGYLHISIYILDQYEL